MSGFLYLVGVITLVFSLLGYIDALGREVEGVNVGLLTEIQATLLLVVSMTCFAGGGLIDAITRLHRSLKGDVRRESRSLVDRISGWLGLDRDSRLYPKSRR